MTALADMPVLTLLGRLSVPLLAATREGSIFFANEAFAAMLGYPHGAVTALKVSDLFESDREAQSAVLAEERPDTPVRLLHVDGGVIRAVMSRSVLRRSDDPVLLVFQDITELLWLEGR